MYGVTERRRHLERRRDTETARKIDMAFLTSKAFDTRAGRTYALLAGVLPDLVYAVFDRPLGSTRRPTASMSGDDDRRMQRTLSGSDTPNDAFSLRT